VRAQAFQFDKVFDIGGSMKIASALLLNDHHQTLIRAVCPEAEILCPAQRLRNPVVWDSEIMDPLVKDADVLIGHRARPGLAEFAPQLRWIQFLGAGIDHLKLTDLLAQDRIILTNASGVSATWIAEYVVASILLFTHRFHITIAAQRRHEWIGFGPFMAGAEGVRGKTVGILGYGAIGRETARLCQAHQMEILALKRNPNHRADNGWIRAGVGDPDGIIPSRWFGPDQRGELLAASDYVVVSLPLTPDTRHFLGKREFDAMKPGAYLVNVGRGPIIDQDAMIAALKDGRLSGAGLDVTDPEPLNPESELWDMENVILTPHSSGARKTYYDVGCELFAENLRRFINGQELINQIDRTHAY
jgi:phosphoglycerate dehydrogenase-like enzyme